MEKGREWNHCEGFALDRPPPQLLEQELENQSRALSELGYVMVSGSDLPNQTVIKQVESIYNNSSRADRLLENGHIIGPLILGGQYMNTGVGIWAQLDK
jgi:hypothetical protein